MRPLSLPEKLLSAIKQGKLIAVNVGSPPAVTARVWIGPAPCPVELGEVPSLEGKSVIAAALSPDGTFIDLVWIDSDEVGGGRA